VTRNENDRKEDDDTVVKEFYVAAAVEDIFPYLTSPRQYWMGADAQIDARPGGACQIDLNGVGSVIGEYLEVDPPPQFTWSYIGRDYTFPDDLSTVEIELIPSGRGALLQLSHRGPDRAGRDRHDAGSGCYLARPALLLAEKDPGPDSKADPSYRHHGEA
jgi:uncharacterized protein YndB with AHSA1/START domain